MNYIKTLILALYASMSMFSIHSMEKDVERLSKHTDDESSCEYTDDESSSGSTDTGVEPYTDVFFGASIKPKLLNLIKNENEEIFMALYDLNDPEIIIALKEKSKKGCKIRIYIDQQNFETAKTSVALKTFTDQKNVTISTIQKRYTDIPYENMHEKIIFFKAQQLAWLGSYNFTKSGPYQWNAVIVSEKEDFIFSIIDELNQLIKFKDRQSKKACTKKACTKKALPKSGSATITAPYKPIYFSPTSIPQLLLNLISHEKKGLRAALFRFTYYPIAEALTKRKKSREKCSTTREKHTPKDFTLDITVDKSFKQDHPEAIRHLIEGGANVFYNTDGQIMHHKLWIFLYNLYKKPVVVMGSYNPTGQADRNWENVCIIDDKNLVQKCLEETDRLSKRCSNMKISEAVYEGKNPKSDYTKRMNGIPGY